MLWADLPDPDVIQVEISPLFNRHVSAGTTLEAEWTDVLWRTECREQGVAWMGDGGFIKFSRMHFTDDISKAVFYLGEILGQADIQSASGNQEIEMTLHKPLSDVKAIMVRIWNHDWDVPRLGEVLLDKITFK